MPISSALSIDWRQRGAIRDEIAEAYARTEPQFADSEADIA